MVRASVVAERAGIPSVSIAASGFVQQARATAKALGAENLAVAEYPGMIMVDSKDEVQRKVREVLIENIIKGLTTPLADAAAPSEPGPRDIVFRGTIWEFYDFFTRNSWSEGLPIMPPTIDAVEKFLAFTDRSPEEVIGVLLPENRQATVWNVAVNGVMAGCRPEYMPVLIAAVEAISDPVFRIEDGGSTAGWEPLIILNGPIIKQLGFNCGAGVMRVGRQANTSIGRFLRLYLRNVAGLRIPPGATDKASIGATFNVVLAENEDVVAELGWKPFSVDRGFEAGDNVVTVQSVVSISPPIYSGGNEAIEHMRTISEFIGRYGMAFKTFAAAHYGHFSPLFVISPSVARVLARDGWTKEDIRRYLYDNTRERAGALERLAWQSGPTSFSFCKCVEEGLISKDFCESTDPDRLVPVFLRPDWIEVVISGDPGRNQSRGYVQHQKQGAPVSRRVRLPANWCPEYR
ncbi:MAG: hypothetical protein HYX92_20675 [Chloroflexi bacterium]|nr:hypothetical protein [Chloroflexota bacterium]